MKRKCVCVCVGLKTSNKNKHSASSYTMVVKYHSSIQEPGFLGEMAGRRAGKVQDKLGISS